MQSTSHSLSRQAVRWFNEKSDVKCGLAPHDLPRRI